MGYNQFLQDMQSFRDGLDCPKSSVSAVQSRFAVGYLNFGLVREAIEKSV